MAAVGGRTTIVDVAVHEDQPAVVREDPHVVGDAGVLDDGWVEAGGAHGRGAGLAHAEQRASGQMASGRARRRRDEVGSDGR